MSLWLPNSGPLYLPPQKPVARVLGTDEYITRTNLYFQAASDRLLTVGNPYFPLLDTQKETVTVPKVSGNQYRVFRVMFPDPNKFALIDSSIYNPDRERLVWALRGIEVSRGGPLGVGPTGHPLFNKYMDTENPFAYPPPEKADNRLNVSFDPKQTQMLIVGCVPAMGQHWDAAKPCAEKPLTKGDCPQLELVNSYIEDGDMGDIGLGAMNFRTLSADRAAGSLDIISEACKYPDFLKMNKDVYGDHIFFFAKREQLYGRHFSARAGSIGDPIPSDNLEYFVHSDTDDNVPQHEITSHNYFVTPSGSLVTSDSQIFNRPYWIQRAQGPNNGMCWGNQLFVTIMDNTHNTNFNISVYKGDNDLTNQTTYKASDFKQYVRHVEEFELDFILQLCKVSLDADVLAHINVMNPNILEDWQLSFVPPPQTGIEDAYRYIHSYATRCPAKDTNKEKEDPYSQYSFWTLDLTERFSSELTQSSLGRRFLYQMGLLNGGKRVRTTVSSNQRKTVKKRKVRA